MYWICGLEGLTNAGDKKKAKTFIKKTFIMEDHSAIAYTEQWSLTDFLTYSEPRQIFEGFLRLSRGLETGFTFSYSNSVYSDAVESVTFDRGRVVGHRVEDPPPCFRAIAWIIQCRSSTATWRTAGHPRE